MKIVFDLLSYGELFNFYPIAKELKQRGYAVAYCLNRRHRKGVFLQDLQKHEIQVCNTVNKDADIYVTLRSRYRKYNFCQIKLVYAVNFLHQNSFANSVEMIEGFDGVLTYGEYTKRQISRSVNASRIKPIGSPMHDDFFNHLPDINEVRKKYGVVGGKKLILYVTTWDEHCGVNLFAGPLKKLTNDHVLIIRPHRSIYDVSGVFQRFVEETESTHYFNVDKIDEQIQILTPHIDHFQSRQGEIVHTMGALVRSADLVIVDAKSGSLAECVLCNPDVPLIGLTTMNNGECEQRFFPEIHDLCTLINQPNQLKPTVQKLLGEDLLRNRRVALRDTLFHPNHGAAASAASDAILEVAAMPKSRSVIAPETSALVKRNSKTTRQRIKKLKTKLRQYKARRRHARLNPSAIVDAYLRTKDWIHQNTVPGEGIVVQVGGKSKYPAYPEVSGYFIPTLVAWGERELALQYARWLVDIQCPNGSWQDYSGENSYVFDSGQILKGLLAVADIFPQAEPAIIKGCDWILENVQPDGRLTTPSEGMWALDSCTDMIHLYCLSPILEAGERYRKPEYKITTQKVLSYYLNQREKILDFHTLSHFYAYILEGLVDLGEIEIVRKAMQQVADLQKKKGAVPAYPNVNWACIPGVMQLAVVWYKLGDLKHADLAFNYAVKMQNSSGGFYGSAGRGANYCPKNEVSWACKYFLDALHWKMRAHFTTAGEQRNSVSLPGNVNSIQEEDGRVQATLQAINNCKPSSIIDLGCGKGRITQFIKQTFPDAAVCGMDINEQNLVDFPNDIDTAVGGLLKIPMPDESFDFALCVEALSHTVDVENALVEMARILSPGGTLLVIDKNIESPVFMKMVGWEQWFSLDKLAKVALRAGFTAVNIKENISYDSHDGSNGLFFAMGGRKSG